jgi:rhamnogalacturonyl hydrolase YesR
MAVQGQKQMRGFWTSSRMTTILLLAAGVSGAAVAQDYPVPTPAMQAIIDKDNGRHFGSSPEDGGPMATDLSPALTPAAIDKAVRKVADWQIATNQPYFDQIWTSGALYVGFLAAAKSTGDAKYRDAMMAVAKKYDWDERSHPAGADDLAIAQMYLDLYLAEPQGVPGKDNHDSHWVQATKDNMDSSLDWKTLKPGDPRLPWWWCDALFMAPPVYARMYRVTDDRKYIDYLDENYRKTYELLYNKQEHLFARDESYITKTEPNGKPMFWSRGEGWVMAGVARIYDVLPADDPRKAFYAQELKEMSARIAGLQGPDGLWHAGLLDPDYYKLPEISGSAFFTYAMAWGINHGILDAKTYKPVVTKAWAGMLKHVYADGRLGCIQQTGAEPAFYRPTASYDFGVGAFLLAGAEMKAMVSHKR